ncbi:MAG: carbonic anhydrase [Phycisphaerales bacterium]|nr:carbonic anhydrase [Phycisphaerales bacterium]
MKSFEKLLLQNKAWAQERISVNPGYFEKLSKIQKPEFLWIGCSDSRVPADRITDTEPGEIFVHRNIANLVIPTDINLLSVLDYATNYLKVKHVIVCGHYGCGGVKAAISGIDHDHILNMWLTDIKNTYNDNKKIVDSLATSDEQVDKMVELSVIKQVNQLAKTYIIEQSWHKQQLPTLHGWVYSLNNGIIKTLVTVEPPLK